MINEAINQLLAQEDLTFSDSKEVFDEIFQGLSTPIQSSSFITALLAKKPTLEEQAAGIISANETFRINLPIAPHSTIRNVALEENEQYIDFMLINDLICSCANLTSLRYCFKSHLYTSRSFNILSSLGIKFKEVNFDFSSELERINLGYIYLSNNEPFYKYTHQLKQNLGFNNILTLFEKLLNPFNCENLFLGINNFQKVEQYAQLALNLNIKNSIIVSSTDNLPYVSIEQETKVAEAWKNKIFAYTVSAEFLDLKKGEDKDLKVENNEHCKEIINEIINNKVNETILNAVILNSGFALYISKATPSVIDGIEYSSKIIKEGILKEKFEQIKKFYS